MGVEKTREDTVVKDRRKSVCTSPIWRRGGPLPGCLEGEKIDFWETYVGLTHGNSVTFYILLGTKKQDLAVKIPDIALLAIATSHRPKGPIGFLRSFEDQLLRNCASFPAIRESNQLKIKPPVDCNPQKWFRTPVSQDSYVRALRRTPNVRGRCGISS